MELEQPTGHFLQLLTHYATYPLPQHVVAVHEGAWTEVGKIVTNGPFKLEAWNRGESMILVRNLKYHGRFEGNVQREELSFLTDWSAALAMYEVDDLDVLDLWGLTLRELDRIRQQHAGEYISVPALGLFYVGFDVSRSPFDDVRVRRAFALTTDNETLANAVLGNFPATGGFVPSGMPGHSAGIGLPYDPAQARQLLAEAGYPDGRGFPTVDLLAPTVRPVFSQISAHLQAQWRGDLGIDVTWKAMELGPFMDRLDREPPQILLFGWVADYPDPDNFLRVCPARHYTRWQNQAYDRLVGEAKHVTDQQVRMTLYGQADRILVEEAAIVPLAYGRRHLLVKAWVSKLPISATGDWYWKGISIEPH